MYNGKTHLLVTYQWNNAEKDAFIIDKDFDTLVEACNILDESMPKCYYFDDGDEFSDWDSFIENGKGEDVFTQFNAQLDKSHNVLAVLRPVTEGNQE